MFGKVFIGYPTNNNSMSLTVSMGQMCESILVKCFQKFSFPAINETEQKQ